MQGKSLCAGHRDICSSTIENSSESTRIGNEGKGLCCRAELVQLLINKVATSPSALGHAASPSTNPNTYEDCMKTISHYIIVLTEALKGPEAA